MEVYVLVPTRKPLWKDLLACFLLALGIVFTMMSLAFFAYFAFAFAFYVGFFFLKFHSFKEYEYSYFDGELRFATIHNKSRRKAGKHFSMDEVLLIAPAGDRSLYKYENDSEVKKIDCTSKKGLPFYEVVAHSGEKVILIKFEPDDRFLDEISKKYAQKITRRKEEA